jgi:hypothetical protein
MKKILMLLLLALSWAGIAQSKYTIEKQLQLNTVLRGDIEDSILVRSADRIVKVISRNELGSNENIRPVSDSLPGIVDTIALQELGGVDKLINGVRIGRGEGNSPNNLVFGDHILTTNTTGDYNTAIGPFALEFNTTGYANTAVGNSSMNSNASAGYTVAIGAAALSKMVSGFGQSVAIGAFSMSDATSTDKNVAVGTYSLRKNTAGFSNTALGHSSLTANTSGNSNNAFGNYSLWNITEGAANIGMGKFAGRYITTGNSNIYIGAEGDPADLTTSNIINIGNKFISKSNNLIVFPQQTIALINSDATGKAIINKEYLATVTAVVNATTTELTAANLNTQYPNAQIGFRVHCTSISGGSLIYEKTNAAWIKYTGIVVNP